MKSDGNRFCEDVALDSFSMAYRDKDSILDQNEKQISLDLYYEDFNFKEIQAHNNKELIKLGFSGTVVLVRIFVKGYKKLKSS